jgi:hypothetical protein
MRCSRLIQFTLSILAFSALASTFNANPTFAADKEKQLVIESPDRGSQKISEADIRAIMEDMKMQTERKSADGVVKAMTPFVYSDGYLKSPGGMGVEQYRIKGIETHRANTFESFASVKNLKYLYYKVDVNVSPDGKTAYAIDKSLVDLQLLGGQRFLLSSAGITKFALVNGEIKIIYNDGTAEIDSAPGLR